MSAIQPLKKSCFQAHSSAHFASGEPPPRKTELLSMGLTGLRAALKSPLPVFRKACRMVSTVISPPARLGDCVAAKLFGLPGKAPIIGCCLPTSTPFTEGAPEVGGDRPYSAPCDDAGDRTGDGERFVVEEIIDMCNSFDKLGTLPSCACSPWTTSANEMKLSLRTSEASSEP